MLRSATRRLSSLSSPSWRPAATVSKPPFAGGRDDVELRSTLSASLSYMPYRGFATESLARCGKYPPSDPNSKRVLAYVVLTGGKFVYAYIVRLLVLKFVLSTSAAEDVLALASFEDLMTQLFL